MDDKQIPNEESETEAVSPIITNKEVEEIIDKSIKAAIAEFRASYCALHEKKMRELEEKLQSLEHTHETSKKALEKENEFLKKKVEDLESNVQGLNHRFKLMDSAHNELEQYGRKNNLLFRGLASVENESSEVTICNFINNTLHLKDSNGQIIMVNQNDIDTAHPLPAKDGSPPLMIARFTRRSLKMAVIRHRKVLKGKSVSISDDLTHKNSILLKTLRENENIDDVWTWEGKLIARVRGERKTRVFTLKDALP